MKKFLAPVITGFAIAFAYDFLNELGVWAKLGGALKQ